MLKADRRKKDTFNTQTFKMHSDRHRLAIYSKNYIAYSAHVCSHIIILRSTKVVCNAWLCIAF